jgi:hypothetical protein
MNRGLFWIFQVWRICDPTTNLCVADVEIVYSYANLHLKASKSDPFRKGVTIQLHISNPEKSKTGHGSYCFLTVSKGRENTRSKIITNSLKYLKSNRKHLLGVMLSLIMYLFGIVRHVVISFADV